MKVATLDDVCYINMGQSPDSSTYNEIGEGLPFYQGNADFGEKHPQCRVWCSEPTKIAAKEDILISVRAPIGALNEANERCCIGRGLAAIRPKGKINKDFLYYFLLSKKSYLISKGTGSTFKAISKNVLRELSIPVPTLHEQEKRARILNTLWKVMYTRRAQLAKLDELDKCRFVELFGDIIRNDKKWAIYNLGDITSSRLGKMLDTKHKTGRNNYPYLANFNVQWFHFELNQLNKMDFDDNERIEFQLKEGDILVCEGGEIGRCAVWHNELKECFFQKALHRVRCDVNKVLPDYVAWWFKYNCDHKAFDVIAGAKATIAHLPGVKLKKLRIAVPDIQLQRDFTIFLRRIDKLRFVIQQSLDEAQKLFDSLMQEYFD